MTIIKDTRCDSCNQYRCRHVPIKLFPQELSFVEKLIPMVFWKLPAVTFTNHRSYRFLRSWLRPLPDAMSEKHFTAFWVLVGVCPFNKSSNRINRLPFFSCGKILPKNARQKSAKPPAKTGKTSFMIDRLAFHYVKYYINMPAINSMKFAKTWANQYAELPDHPTLTCQGWLHYYYWFCVI